MNKTKKIWCAFWTMPMFITHTLTCVLEAIRTLSIKEGVSRFFNT